MKPIWLLGVDGVINADQPGWSGQPLTAHIPVREETHRIQWAPNLVGRIRELVFSDLVDVWWCSHLCGWTQRLSWEIDLPMRFPDAFAVEPMPIGTALELLKLSAVHRIHTSGSPFVWTDNFTPTDGPIYDQLTTDGMGLLIAPDSQSGLQPGHLDQIEAFCTHHAHGRIAP